MIHLIPSDQPLTNLNPPLTDQDAQATAELNKVLEHNVPIMMQNNAKSFPQQAPTTDSRKLAELLEENPQIKELVMNKPEAVLAGLEDNPSLKPLFEGVDINLLSKQLREQQEQTTPTQEPATPPQATAMSDQELTEYLQEHEKLLHYLLNDVETLKEAVAQQPKLQVFFAQTTPEQVRARVQELLNSKPQTSSLEDVARGANK